MNMFFLCIHLREVGLPSRNILHGRGVQSKSRIRGRRLGGRNGALACEWLKFRHRAAAGMRNRLGNSIFREVALVTTIQFLCLREVGLPSRNILHGRGV